MAAKPKRKLSGKNAYDIINGRKYKFACDCKRKTLDCVTPAMWDAVSKQLYKK